MTCTATTRCGTATSSGWCWTSRTSGWLPEYELRAFPGPGTGPGLELLTAIMRQYQQVTGRQLSPARVMAWHLRQALGDVLWRSEAGLPLADHRTPPQWVEDLAARFSALGIGPEAPRWPCSGRSSR